MGKSGEQPGAHRPTLKQSNKPHKGGKKNAGKRTLKPPVAKVHVLTGKRDRKNFATQTKETKVHRVKQSIDQEKSRDVPKLIAVIPFHPSADLNTFRLNLIKFLCLECLTEAASKIKNATAEQLRSLQAKANQVCEGLIQRTCRRNIITISLPEWAGKRRRQLQFLMCDIPISAHYMDTASAFHLHLDILDICKGVDGVMGLFGTTSCEPNTTEARSFSRWGYDFLSLLRKQGLPPVFGVAVPWVDCETEPRWETQTVKQRAANLDILKRCFDTEINSGAFFDVAAMIIYLANLAENDFWERGLKDIPKKARNELVSLVRHVSEVSFRSFPWREESRGYLVSEGARLQDSTLTVWGYLRGLGFSCKLPVHVTGVGDFPLERLSVIPRPGVGEAPDFSQPVVLDKLQDQAAFERLWSPRAAEDEFSVDTASSDGDGNMEETSSVDAEDEMGEMSDNTVDGEEDEGDTSDDEWIKSLLENMPPSIQKKPMDLQPRTRNEMEFPDEADTPSNQPARIRFVKYRGLRDFRNSRWDDSMDRLPDWYSAIVDIKPYKQMMRHINAKFLNILEEVNSAAGETARYVVLELRVPPESSEIVASRLLHDAPFLVSTLSPVERKLSVQHFACTKTQEAGASPLASKSVLLVQHGFRRIEVSALFSASQTKSESLPIEVKDPSSHKLAYRRFFPEGERRPQIVSFVGPVIQTGRTPMIAWLLKSPAKMEAEIVEKCQLDDLPLPTPMTPVLSGHFITTDPGRLIVKRILLTGYPHRIKKRTCSVRRMFFNREDVLYYSPVQLFARSGGRLKEGKIKEPLGTHGDMKCHFSEPLTHGETVTRPNIHTSKNF
eukprot:Gregarina_sp_Poly_1__10796@NODE_82_length_15568_cov_98_251403_g70_i0_p3_GENE_NODE_82_length_15568_cov_98_251403_g70_i0NODE_82_length_15568_cov_98_251403_g70_i0_p3_ORF_typecomplete_len839_score120_12RIBIOP_C/PF04950_12/2_8e53AARP2CN/PF08142_12/2_1e12_NODE_82_length_15568_cov_98_251403_g70_i067539269